VGQVLFLGSKVEKKVAPGVAGVKWVAGQIFCQNNLRVLVRWMPPMLAAALHKHQDLETTGAAALKGIRKRTFEADRAL